jgi:NADH:ubiquinone oxidoreductase subunit 5 (subunit L)/multisubunit Na+/H+ antiporter MnhA subunit
MVHLTHQAFMKDTRFFCTGAVSVQTQTGKKKISEMDGTRKKNTSAGVGVYATGSGDGGHTNGHRPKDTIHAFTVGHSVSL